MREYNVILKRDVDYDGFWNDIESDTDGGKLYIPNRRVEFTNERPASLRQCWYLLTDEEAEQLKLDDRVYDVEIPPEHRTDIVMMPKEVQQGDFTKTSSDTGAYINWGLIRSNSTTNNYGTSTNTTESYIYSLAGNGVDVVIQDSGLQVDHPEFTDKNGNSRVRQIDWRAASGLSFTQNINHYRDYDGHGTHVAGIVAGKTYGWAKKADIYSVKVDGLEGSGDSGTGISVTYCFDAIKAWHNGKPTVPNGYKRPTVVNMSWGYGTFYNSVTNVNYRGTSYTDSSTTGNASYRETTYGLMNKSGAAAGYTYVCNARVSSVDVDVQEMIDAGIIVCIAAGNRAFKVDIAAGTDYNNYVVTDQGTNYYHRGSSPYDDEAIIVGSLDSTSYDASTDKKATYSECGPGVTIYAPGTNIMSACSTTNAFSGENYYGNPTYKQTNISGTSMASPQVAGICALLMESNPQMTPAQLKANLLANAGTAIYSVVSNNDWSVTNTLKGGSDKVAYNKFNSIQTSRISGLKMTGLNFRII
jgi:subtilisin family serine protease